MKKNLILVSAFLLATLLIQQPALAQDCDRACLEDTITRYLTALVAHDPKQLSTTADVRFTEDHIEKPVGEGMWQSIDSLGTFRQDILDVKNSTAGVHVVGMEEGMPVLIATRLKVENGQVSEIESTVVRNQEEGMIFRPDEVRESSAAMNLTPTPEQRNTREEMIELALLYPEGLRVGSFVKADAKFAEDAYRFENGQLMAGPGCTFFPGCDNIREQGLPTLSGIVAQVAAVDEEQGIVWLRMNFGAGSIMRGEGELSVWEMFKIYDGQINAVEAFMEIVPTDTPFGWSY